MSEPTATNRWLPHLLAVGIVLGSGVGILLWLNSNAEPPSDPPATKGTPAPPPFTETRYQNLGPDAHYIGSAACAECHKSNHASYLLTPHSRALAELDPNIEPPDGSFHHAPSGRSYRVYRQDAKFRHEEIVKDSDGSVVAKVDLPIKYLVGSGNFCRSYIVEVDGFLHESPLTWYTAKKKWDLSPGYDFSEHWSFERPITTGCLHCHSGRVEPIGGAVHKMKILEQAIGCERCHGPGSLHAERYRTGLRRDMAEDLTIVNPSKLSRPLLESVCAECHLNGPATVTLRGRGDFDFRPGRPLTDYRIDYRYDTGSEQMTVVGHIEQLRRSPCYQKSETLTCLTCHDLHAREQPKDRIAYFRQKCLDCHNTNGCSVSEPERQAKQQDNCSACHMPRGDTDIPHIAFTHHRIGKHAATPKTTDRRVPILVPTDDIAHLTPLERKRNLGLAYYQAARPAENTQYADAFRARARQLLEEVRAEDLSEGITAQALADIYWKVDWEKTRTYATEAVQSADLNPEARGVALMLLATCDFEDQDFKAAIARLNEVVRLRRLAEDWRMLGICHLLDGEPRSAVQALEYALSIRPFKPEVYGGLFEVYRRTGNHARAADYLKKAQWLEKNRQE